MEGSSASKRVAAPRSDDDRDRVLDGVRVDAEWEHKPVCICTSGRESVWACTFAVQDPVFRDCR